MRNELMLYCERCGMPLESDKKLDSSRDNEFIVRPCESCLSNARGEE